MVALVRRGSPPSLSHEACEVSSILASARIAVHVPGRGSKGVSDAGLRGSSSEAGDILCRSSFK